MKYCLLTLVAITAFLILSHTGVYSFTEEEHIYNGEPVSDNEYYPFLVNLFDMCSGTILNERFILTAAHCYDNQTITVKLTAGSNYFDQCDSSKCQQRSFKSAPIVPPQFNDCLSWDLRVVDLGAGNELFFTKWVLPAVLEKKSGPDVGSEVMVVGWGKTTDDGKGSKSLNKYTEKVLDLNDCPYMSGPCKNPSSTSGQFCSYSPISTACKGDSGGPVFDKTTKVVTGVVSTTTFYDKKKCGIIPEQKSLHASVGQGRKWIIEKSRQDLLLGWGYSKNLFWSLEFQFSNKPYNLMPSIDVVPIFSKIKPAHGDFVLGISVSNLAYSWGWGGNYELGDGKTPYVEHPIVHNHLGIENIIDMCGGISHSLALSSDGKVYEWGTNPRTNSKSEKPKLVQFPDNEHIASISCGFYHNLAISNKNRLYFWGSNENGEGGNIEEECSIDKNRKSDIPILVDALKEKKVYSVCAGKSTSFVTTTDGFLYAWGLNKEGLLGTGSTSNCVGKPSKLDLNANATIVYCGNHFSFVKAGEEVYGWGRNHNKVISDSGQFIPQPVKTTIGSIVDMTIGDNFVLYKRGSKWYGRGNNDMGQLGIGKTSLIEGHVELSSLNVLSTRFSVKCRKDHCFAIPSSGNTLKFFHFVIFISLVVLFL